MRVRLLILCLLVTTLAFGQMQDLMKLAEGKMVLSTILYDSNEDLYGYFYLYKRDADKVNKTMEYVLLDKNLNRAANGTFVSNSYKEGGAWSTGVKCAYLDCSMMGDKLILTNFYSYQPVIGNEYPLTSGFQIISLKDNSVSRELKFENDSIVELPADAGMLKKQNKKSINKLIIHPFDNGSFKGFYVTEMNRDGLAFQENIIRMYNEDKKLLWKYEYNGAGAGMYNYTHCSALHLKNNNLYLMEQDISSMKVIRRRLIKIDIRTGEKIYTKVLKDEASKYEQSVYVKEIDGKLVISGDYSPKGQYKKSLGFYKIVLDESGDEIYNKSTTWLDYASFISVKPKGKLKGGYYVWPKKFFFRNDGSVAILTEQRYPGGYKCWWLPLLGWLSPSPAEVKDLNVFHLDKDFHCIGVDQIHREKTYPYLVNYYLFSQSIKNESGSAFFTCDNELNPEVNKKQWMLGIHTILDGKLTTEKISMYSKKKYLIDAIPAKEGYIMLREYNEKDKYNQIRLEKLNY